MGELRAIKMAVTTAWQLTHTNTHSGRFLSSAHICDKRALFYIMYKEIL